jgi:hypothetical protein
LLRARCPRHDYELFRGPEKMVSAKSGIWEV